VAVVTHVLINTLLIGCYIGILRDQQHRVLACKQLEDGGTLADYNDQSEGVDLASFPPWTVGGKLKKVYSKPKVCSSSDYCSTIPLFSPGESSTLCTGHKSSWSSPVLLQNLYAHHESHVSRM